MAKLDRIQYDNTSYEIVPEIAPLYASNKSYEAGDLVIKDAVLYRFKSAHAAWVAWSGLDVEELEVGKELVGLKQNLERLDAHTLGLYPPMSVADTAVASFTDGADDIPVKALTVDVDPVQDLHGYSNPWPGGGGKNLLPMTINGMKSANPGVSWNGNVGTSSGVTITLETLDGVSVSGIKISGTPTTTLYLRVGAMDLKSGVTYRLTGCPSTPPVNDVLYVSSQPSGFGNWVDSGSGMNYTPASDYSGILFYIRIWENTNQNNSMWYPMVSLASVSDATFAPYSNICPISGWTGVNVTRTGKNLLKFPYLDTTKTQNGINYTVLHDGKININGTATADNGFDITRTLISDLGLSVGDTIYITTGVTYSASYYIRLLYSDNASGIGRMTETDNAVTITEDMVNREVTVNLWVVNGTNAEVTFSPMVRFSQSESTDYEPYKGHTHAVDFPTEAGTVYGGTLDVTNGVLTVDMKCVDMGTLNWTAYATTIPFLYASLPDANPYTHNVICEMYKEDGSATGANGTFFFNGTQLRMYDSAYDSGSAFKTAMSGVHLVYELATPVTYQLNPTEVTTLLRNNNIFSDTGNVNSLTYRADLKTYIDEKLA